MPRTPRTNRETQRAARQLRQAPTDSERLLWKHLKCKQMGVSFRQQAPLLHFIADFYAPEVGLIVELDGRYHHDRAGRDAFRDWLLAQHGMMTLRIPSRQVFEDLPGVLRQIAGAIRRARQRGPARPGPGN